MTYKRFNDTLKQKLREKNKSLRELCRESGIDASFLSKVLKNKRNPPSDEKVLHKIASSLGMDPIKLVIYTGKVPEKYYDFFCSDRFIEWIGAGGRLSGRNAAPVEKKQTPPDKISAEKRAPRQARADMSEELL